MAKLKLPNDAAMERSVLGAMMISSEALITALGSLTIEDFFSRENQLVFQSINNLYDGRSIVDVQMVFNELSNTKQIDNVGGLDYIDNICESAIGLTSLEHYIKSLKDMSVARKLLNELTSIINNFNEGIDVSLSDFISNAGNSIAGIVEQRRVSDFIKIDEYLNRVNKDLDLMKNSGTNTLVGISTGFSRLNNYTNGWQNDNMIILAARPSVGKTALALNFILTAARKTKKTVAFFSLEMSGELITKRLLAMESEVSLSKITTGNLSTDDKARLQEATARLKNLKIFIDDTPSIKMNDLFAKAKKLQNNYNDLAFVVVDYIGLITSSSKSESRQLEVSEYSRRLKDLARVLHIPVLVLCQLSRAVDSRENKEPIMSDLRESGAIEQDADIIMLLSKQGDSKSKKNKNATDKNKDTSEEDKKEENNTSEVRNDQCVIKVDVAKNRNGQTGDTFLLFQKKYSRFYDLTPENQESFIELIGQDMFNRINPGRKEDK